MLTRGFQADDEAYVALTDFLGRPPNDVKTTSGIQVTVLGITIDTSTSKARFPSDKLKKARLSTVKPLSMGSLIFLSGSLSLRLPDIWANVVRLGRVFIPHTWNFTASLAP
jgi:hypothetical protein